MIHWTLTLCSLVLVKSDCIRFRRKSRFFLFGVIYDLCCDFNLWYFQSLYCKTFIHLVVFTSCLEFLIVTFYAAQSATSSSVGWSCRSDFWVKPTRDTWKFVEARLRAEFSYLVLAAENVVTDFYESKVWKWTQRLLFTHYIYYLLFYLFTEILTL